MKNYLEIKSFGEIDIQAFTLIGASTKVGDETKIGMYGSGNKYAIASLMRQGIDFKVFSGEDEIVFAVNSQSFRGQDFKVITVNGAETSLTTSMGGKDWNTAFAPIREIYSNALDEDSDSTLQRTTEVVAEKGYTKFFVEMTEEVGHFYKNIHLYFCSTNPKILETSNRGTIYTNTDDGKARVFRKGILAYYNERQKALFHYNLQEVDINESRVLKYNFQIDTQVAKIFKESRNSVLINNLLLGLKGGNAGYLEHGLDWDTWGDFSDTWLEVCGDKKFAPAEYLDMFDKEELEGAYILPAKLLKALKTQFTDLNVLGIGSKTDDIFIQSSPSQILVNKVIDAVALLNSTRYKERLEGASIEYVKFSKENIQGLALHDTIYLSTKLDAEDVNTIAKIIIEENEHNRSGFKDETRRFQDHLFNLYFDALVK